MVQPQRQPDKQSTILVVEDDAATSDFYVDLLSMIGYNVVTAMSGRAALVQLSEKPVDGILLDRRLPDLDGLSVCRYIRETIDARVPIIMLTAESNDAVAAMARDAGVTDFIRKPFQPDQLLKRLGALVQP